MTATEFPSASNIYSTDMLGGLTMVAPTFKAIGGRGHALTIFFLEPPLTHLVNYSLGIAAKLIINCSLLNFKSFKTSGILVVNNPITTQSELSITS